MKKLAWFFLLAVPLVAQTSLPNPQSRVAGRFIAFNYGGWSIPLYTVPSGTGSKTFAPLYDTVQLPDGRRFMPFATNASLTVGNENVTVSVVGAGCVVNNTVPGGCVLTATFSNTHTNADKISSATFGLQEALNDASASGGGTVTVESAWASSGGTTAIISAATVATTCTVEDGRTGYGNFVAASAAPGVYRALVGQVKTGASYANGSNSLVGVRGLATVPSSGSATSGFIFGTQGKFIGDGATIDVGSAHVAGLYGQMSLSGATITSGHVAIGILSGQSLPASSNVDGLYMESGGNSINSLVKGIFNANYVIDLSKESGPAYALPTSSTSAGACAQTGGIVAAKALAVKIDNTNYWIPLCTAL